MDNVQTIWDLKFEKLKEQLEPNSQLARLNDTIGNFEISLGFHRKCVDTLIEIERIMQRQYDQMLAEMDFDTLTDFRDTLEVACTSVE